MQSQYLAIQHAALRTVDQLIRRYGDRVVQKSFAASTGVLDLCDILEVDKVYVLSTPKKFSQSIVQVFLDSLNLTIKLG